MLIKIKNLELFTKIGIHEWEDSIDRKIIVNVEMEIDDLKSLKSDDIADTLDYDTIINKIKKLNDNNRFQLIERMAQTMMDQIMEDAKIKKCKLEVDKVGVYDFVDSFSITIERSRGE